MRTPAIVIWLLRSMEAVGTALARAQDESDSDRVAILRHRLAALEAIWAEHPLYFELETGPTSVSPRKAAPALLLTRLRLRAPAWVRSKNTFIPSLRLREIDRALHQLLLEGLAERRMTEDGHLEWRAVYGPPCNSTSGLKPPPS